MTKEIIIIADYTEETALSASELCEICGIEPMLMQELVAYDIITPRGVSVEDWVFDMQQLQRLRVAQRLQRDLELNLAGVALVLHLLDEMNELRSAATVINKHFIK